MNRHDQCPSFNSEHLGFDASHDSKLHFEIIRNDISMEVQLFEITLFDISNCGFAFRRRFVFLLQIFQPPLQVTILVRQSLCVF